MGDVDLELAFRGTGRAAPDQPVAFGRGIVLDPVRPVPGAALASLVALAGTTRLDPSVVAASLGSVWAVAVAWPAASRRVPADLVTQLVASAPSQLTALLVALAAIALTIARRDTVAYRRNA